MKRLGLDIGAGSLNAAVVDNEGNIQSFSKELKSRPLEKTKGFLKEIKEENYIVGVTGTNGKFISELADIDYINNAVSVLKGFEIMCPEAKTVIDIGNQSSSYYLFGRNNRKMVLEDWSSNSLCGAGGGALIDKMRNRLGFSSIDAFVEAASGAETQAHISARCAVFGESDVVHHYQRGTHVDSIAAGLCQVLARNFLINVCKNKVLEQPIYVIGGVSQNRATVNFLEQGLKEKIIVPDFALYVKAVGAANVSESEISIREMIERLSSYRKNKVFSLPSLKRQDFELSSYKVIAKEGENKIILSLNQDYTFEDRIEAFLGLDVGSVSTKAVLIDKEEKFILGIYQRTGGKPIDAVKEVITRLGELDIKGKKLKSLVGICRAGTTGSGRDVAGRIVGADIVKNEITAQAKGAEYFFPNVDTVFEIGGQDSKYISMQKGAVIDNEMNKACAASTGSFLEEQSKVLGISIEKEFESHALKSKNPLDLGDRCAIFMTSSLMSYQDSLISDKCAGLTYSICHNYLNRVVGKRKIGENIVFQGAVAFNRAVVSGFETILDKKINVPTYPHLTGAIGVARIAKKNYENGN